jgi:signal transduction histidine kinase/DNA-binding NarL/FixJ family response regulator
MKTILALSAHPNFASEVRNALNSDEFRVIHRLNVDESEPLLVHGLITACILDTDLLGVESVWIIERLRRRGPNIPIIAYTESVQSDWEEEAFLRGVTQVLTKPIRQRLLVSILERLSHPITASRPAKPLASFEPSLFRSNSSAVANLPVIPSQTLDVLRDFSSILTHSLDAEAMLKQFLQFLREILSVNRAAIFLNRPSPAQKANHLSGDSRRLHSAAAIGLSAGLLETFELSLDSGIGGQISRSGRILRRDGDEARADDDVQREFEVLGAQVAVPIPDRDSIVGVAVFDGRFTGEPLVNAELELIFHLLEQVGLGLRNISLHDQLADNHEMMTDVLRELSSACIVVGRDLKVLHANKSARRHFGRKNERTGGLEFSELPQMLGAKIYQVLKTGVALEPFRYEPDNAPGSVYNITVVPFQRSNSLLPSSALLTADDLTQTERLRQLELEAANLRLVHMMADRLAHEIGNALVPISTHHQLLGEKFKDPEFRESLDHALGEGVKRITRLINQMRFLARDGFIEQEAFAVQKLIEDAYQEAIRQQPSQGALLKMESGGKPFIISGNRPALKHALSEILLNALQANPKGGQVGVKLQTAGENGGRSLTIEVQDAGTGFSAEAARKIPAPFYTTRNVGLGLGLAVTQKIIESHHGTLEIVPSASGIVRVSLPVEHNTVAGAV